MSRVVTHDWSDSREARRRLTDLLLRLGSKDTAARWTAQTELRQSFPVPVEMLLPQLIRLARIRRQSPFLLGVGLLAACVLLLGLLLIFDALFGRSSHLPVLLAGLVGVVLMARRWRHLRGASMRTLTHFNDVRVTGPLLMALDHNNREVRLISRELLLNLLPRLRANHADLLDAEARKRLVSLLEGEDAPLTVAALQALAQVDVEEATPQIRRLAEGIGPAANYPQVRDMALACQSALKARQIQRRVSQNLLRVVNTAQPDTNTLQTASHVDDSEESTQ